MAGGANDALAELQRLMNAAAPLPAPRRTGGVAVSSGGMTNEQYHNAKAIRAEERQAKKDARRAGLHGSEASDFELKRKLERLGFGKGGDATKTLAKDLVGFGSSIEAKNGKLQLMGDEMRNLAGYVYGKNGQGFKGFWDLKEMLDAADPSAVGAAVGNAASTDDGAQKDERKNGDAGAFTFPNVCRVFHTHRVKKNEQTGEIEDEGDFLVAGIRDVMYTGKGRAFAVSAERLQDVCRLGGGGGEVSVTGTDNITVTGSNIVIESEPDTHLTAKCSKDANGTVRVKIGVYWKRK